MYAPYPEAPALLKLVLSKPELVPIGLMTMAPLVTDQNQARPVFRELRELARSLEQTAGIPLPVLSMGMSNDFESAMRRRGDTCADRTGQSLEVSPIWTRTTDIASERQ